MSWAGVPVSAVIVLTYLTEMQACLAGWCRGEPSDSASCCLSFPVASGCLRVWHGV